MKNEWVSRDPARCISPMIHWCWLLSLRTKRWRIGIEDYRAKWFHYHSGENCINFFGHSYAKDYHSVESKKVHQVTVTLSSSSAQKRTFSSYFKQRGNAWSVHFKLRWPRTEFGSFLEWLYAWTKKSQIEALRVMSCGSKVVWLKFCFVKFDAWLMRGNGIVTVKILKSWIRVILNEFQGIFP